MALKLWADSRVCPVAAIGGCPLTGVHDVAVAASWCDVEALSPRRVARFRTGGDQVTARARVHPARRDDLVGTALAVRAEGTDADGRVRLEATFQGPRHAEWALWQLATSADALAPRWLRTSLHDRAAAIAARDREPS